MRFANRDRDRDSTTRRWAWHARRPALLLAPPFAPFEEVPSNAAVQRV